MGPACHVHNAIGSECELAAITGVRRCSNGGIKRSRAALLCPALAATAVLACMASVAQNPHAGTKLSASVADVLAAAWANQCLPVSNASQPLSLKGRSSRRLRGTARGLDGITVTPAPPAPIAGAPITVSPAPVAAGVPVAAAAPPSLPPPQVPLQPPAATVAPTAAAAAAAAAAAVATAAPSQPLQTTAAPLPPAAATLPPLVAPVPAASSAGDAALAASSGGSGSSSASSGGSGSGSDGDRFNIVLVNVGEPNPKYDQFMEGAKLRWEAVIVGDVPDLPGFPTADLFGGYLQYEGDGVPDTTDVDDIIIAYQFAPIDGFGDSSGDMLGTTMITKYRDASQGSFPISAQMTFDTANVDADIDAGAFDVVVLHEMAHALGFGDWATGKFTSPCGTSCLDYASNAGADGCIASTKYAELGYTDPLLVEFGGAPGDGSYCCHWDEGQLGDELMTPGINYGGYNPLTMLSIASFEDLGYMVSYDAADPMDAISALGVGWRHTRANRHLRQRREASARLKAQRRLYL